MSIALNKAGQSFNMNDLMKEIKTLNTTLSEFKPVYRLGEEQYWKFEEACKTVTFYRRSVLNTTPNNFDLYIPYPFILHRIDMGFDTAGTPSANAKTMNMRIYSGISPSSYTILSAVTANTDYSLIVQGGIEYKYKAGTKLSLVFSDFTNNDNVEIAITIEKVI